MEITYFMRLGLTALAVLNPILSLIISNIMLKWEEKGIVGADATAKSCIGIALIALTVYIIVGIVLTMLVILTYIFLLCVYYMMI